MAHRKLGEFTGTLVELDVLIEQERISAAAVIAAAFQHDIQVALIRVGEINKINSARIVAAAQVTSAKAATEAEVCSATLASLAGSALADVKARGSFGLTNRTDRNLVINAASALAAEEISGHASDVIKAIAAEAEAAVKRIKSTGDEAIQQIRALAEDTQRTVRSHALLASEKLEALKSKPRLERDVLRHAEEAADLLVEQHDGFSRDLSDRVAKACEGMSELAGNAIAEINASVSQAERRINESRDKVIKLLDEYAQISTR